MNALVLQIYLYIFLKRTAYIHGQYCEVEKKKIELHFWISSKVIARFTWYLWGVSGRVTSFFWKMFFLEYSSFAEISAKKDFFICGKMPFLDTWHQKMRFFGEKWFFSTNMLDSGQNSLKTPHITRRSFISAISADLSKIENLRYSRKFSLFLHRISA